MNPPAGSKSASRRIEIGGDLDRRSAEALSLELRALAKRYGVEVRDLRVSPVEESRGEEPPPG